MFNWTLYCFNWLGGYNDYDTYDSDPWPKTSSYYVIPDYTIPHGHLSNSGWKSHEYTIPYVLVVFYWLYSIGYYRQQKIWARSWRKVIEREVAEITFERMFIEGILRKGPYLPCVSMVGRAFWQDTIVIALRPHDAYPSINRAIISLGSDVGSCAKPIAQIRFIINWTKRNILQ